MEAIMSFTNKPTGKNGEALLETDIQDWDAYMFNNELLMTSDMLDNEKAIAWGSYMGILLGDFEMILNNYCNKKNRKYFFAYNNFGQPTCFFDVENKEELKEMWDKELKAEQKRQKLSMDGKPQTRKFMNPRKKLN